MDAQQLARIQSQAALFTKLIQGKEEEIGALKIGLHAVQDQCPHDGVRTYRQRRVGSCPICQQKFLNESQVDKIFST